VTAACLVLPLVVLLLVLLLMLLLADGGGASFSSYFPPLTFLLAHLADTNASCNIDSLTLTRRSRTSFSLLNPTV
jgi:hypothetical protein